MNIEDFLKTDKQLKMIIGETLSGKTEFIQKIKYYLNNYYNYSIIVDFSTNNSIENSKYLNLDIDIDKLIKIVNSISNYNLKYYLKNKSELEELNPNECNIIKYEKLSSGCIKIILIIRELIYYSDFDTTIIIDNFDNGLDINQQKQFLKAIIDNFPNMKFIIVTNSPIVISSISDKNKYLIYKFYHNDDIVDIIDPCITNPYGLSYDNIISNFLGYTPRSKEIYDKLLYIRKFITQLEKITSSIHNTILFNVLIESIQKDFEKLKELIDINDPEFVRLKDRFYSLQFVNVNK